MPAFDQRPPVLLLACLIEAFIGRPALFQRYLPHPVGWIASLIGTLDRHLNRPRWSETARYGTGILALAVIALSGGGAGFLLERLVSDVAWGLPIVAFFAAFGLAARNLHDHVRAVLPPLKAGHLAEARAFVGRIVGRDTDTLDESGIAKAACESLAESFCDGVIAPLFWFLVGGLGGLFLYKAVNTADSLIGHKEPRWRAFGWASARADDLLNLIPARIAGCLIVLASGGSGWRVMLRDAGKHASPNGGWPEAALAGALGRRLGGPVSYDGIPAARAILGDGPLPDAGTLRDALNLYVRACLLAGAIVAVVGVTLYTGSR